MVVYIVIVSVHLQLEGYSLDIISILLQKVFLELIVSFLMCVIHDIWSTKYSSELKIPSMANLLNTYV